MILASKFDVEASDIGNEKFSEDGIHFVGCDFIVSILKNSSYILDGLGFLIYSKATLSATEPPLSWISMMWAFFCLLLRIFIWVWQMTRMTVQYFFIEPDPSQSPSFPGHQP